MKKNVNIDVNIARKRAPSHTASDLGTNQGFQGLMKDQEG